MSLKLLEIDMRKLLSFNPGAFGNSGLLGGKKRVPPFVWKWAWSPFWVTVKFRAPIGFGTGVVKRGVLRRGETF